jgi:hypothetical protein
MKMLITKSAINPAHDHNSKGPVRVRANRMGHCRWQQAKGGAEHGHEQH